MARTDPSRKIVEPETGDRIAYGKLLLATGSRPRTLSLPGAHLEGVHCLRNATDVVQGRKLIAERAVLDAKRACDPSLELSRLAG